ncbi:pentapeptide repeat-containing protein [Plantactinospora soyae]|uniref:Uncharacterized protein YjbI with pentapeptide repeats n=1 Tax=Plantactinospora soyae TaxID=1544732 RepID=A0A927RB53_9ACTN|nr:pentapeptide repeat-containing protein [Plantactinospora soyae]MBE1491326.1 uncharacterized protein YjbI with pentapeptide repeats [Plantactinospora soyae]
MGNRHLALDNVTVDAAFFDEVVEIASRNRKGIRDLSGCSFEGATFLAGCRFGGCSFPRGANFIHASFDSPDFRNASFGDEVDFTGAEFVGTTRFENCTFGNHVKFGNCKFTGPINFGGATIGDGAIFWQSDFSDTAAFGDARFGSLVNWTFANFRSEASFSSARFGDGADFSRTQFHDFANFSAGYFGVAAQFSNVKFNGVTKFRRRIFARGALFSSTAFRGDTSFEQASFEGGDVTFVGADVVCRNFSLEGITFTRAVHITVDARSVSFKSTRFLNGGHVRMNGPSELDIEDASFPQPFMISSEVALGTTVRSVARADLSGLALSEVDLNGCRFVGSHNLDKLQIQATERPFSFMSTTRFGVKRMVIAEELELRKALHPQGLAEGQSGVTDEQVASIYRQLRKGREDRKDEPGAADFYYGEMLMRMRAAHTSRAERVIIGAYWLISGFGLRASRAFVAFLIAVTAGTAIIALCGLSPDSRGAPRYSLLDATLIALKSCLGWQSPSAVNVMGEYISLALRFVGPVLLGLCALAIRGRIKRG